MLWVCAATATGGASIFTYKAMAASRGMRAGEFFDKPSSRLVVLYGAGLSGSVLSAVLWGPWDAGLLILIGAFPASMICALAAGARWQRLSALLCLLGMVAQVVLWMVYTLD